MDLLLGEAWSTSLIKLRKAMWTNFNAKKLGEETFDVPCKKLRSAHQIILVFEKFWSIRQAGLLEQVAELQQKKKEPLNALDIAVQFCQEQAACVKVAFLLLNIVLLTVCCVA